MLPPFGLWLINLIMSKEFYITSLDNNMNRGTFQGVFAFFLYFLLGRDVRHGQEGEGTDILPQERIAKLLRGCRIVLRSTEMPRHGRRGKELSSHGGRVATVSSGIENQKHNSYSHLAAKRSSRGSMSVPSPSCPRRTSLTLWLNIKRRGAVNCTSVFTTPL